MSIAVITWCLLGPRVI